ncbi:carboxymuconolactone decarboxylase family protein [Aquihabitans daechungensis]|uniref:carboxymuconolactone decarboxylase family protein n=1 Tax=Aquihabitans daechungensis TaxID=1052257 RepID=UPI003B9F2785
MTTTTGTRFPAHEQGSASGHAGQLLDDIYQRHGSAGHMVRTMASSPAMLAGYLDLSRAAKRVSLNRRLSEQVSIAVQATLGCDTCLDAHIAAARAAGVADHDIDLAKSGTASAPDAALLIDFSLQVLIAPGQIDEATIQGLRDAGFDDRQVLDIVAIVSLNFLTGSFNLVTGV